jgi:hypothetical protein
VAEPPHARVLRVAVAVPPSDDRHLAGPSVASRSGLGYFVGVGEVGR